MGIEIFKKHLREKRAVKAYVNSNSHNDTEKISKCAQETRLSAIEIKADKELFEIAKSNTRLPIFVSSIHPYTLLEAAKWGADAIQIAKFDKVFTTSEIYNIVVETLALVSEYDIYTCVSIPNYFDEHERKELIKKLNILGVDLIQSENNQKEDMENLLKSVYTPFSIGYDLKHNNYQEAFECGANAISVEINANDTYVATKTKMMSLVGLVSYRNSLHKEILKTKSEYKQKINL